MTWLSRFRRAGVLVLLILVGGCASVPKEYRDPRDPLESYNRGMHQFNTDFDNAFFKPVAKGYKAITPEPVDRGVTNFFNNIADVTSAVNNLLQFKLSRFGSDVGRVATNSTVGILGFFDVATNMGLPSYKEDFGQTLGYWGADSSPYFVLPLLGPSTVRDTVGLAGDIVVDPFFSLDESRIYWGFIALRAIDTRADLLTASKILEEAAVDPYIFVRDAYLQRRRNQIFDGNPPPDPYEEDLWEEEQQEGAGGEAAADAG
ncbi:MAG: VacJ family lipoprotein [Pseudomonadota bacterium]|nr:VacJ family lipoprotein [Pseudomonadota bacterium]